jgi:predicted nucleotidyltransferase
VQSVRAKPEHRHLLQEVAEMLRRGDAALVERMIERASERPLGPFVSEDAAVAFLRDRLVTALRPRAIWLFGSRARGTAGPHSDVDLLVVLPDGLDPQAYSNHAVSEPVAGCGLAYDIVPCSMTAFERDRGVPHTLVHTAVQEGKPIYLDRRLREQVAA